MNPDSDNPGRILDRALSEMRHAPVPAEGIEEASARVLGALEDEYRKVASFPDIAAEGVSAGRIEGCEGFRALIPAYLARSLAPARALLWEDHLRECVDCRRALEKARHGVRHPEAVSVRASGGGSRRLRFIGISAVAAALAIAFFGIDGIRSLLWPIDAHAMTQTVNGGLYLVSGQDARAIAAGRRIEPGQAVRAGSGSSAILQLADGSRIEMGARAELTLANGRDGVRVRLRRGSVIVTAEGQSGGHLYVETPDCEVSATGTVFAVSAAPKGSRISVIRGEARVLQGGATEILGTGRQFATDAAMENVSLRDEIRWSPNAAAHNELLGALVDLHTDLRRRMEGARMRFESDLKGMAPAGTVVLASLPNVSEPLADAYTLFKQRVQESDTLREWWSANAGMARNTGPAGSMDEMVARLTRLGSHLGPEIVLAFPPNGQNESPIVFAGVNDADAALAAIQNDLEQMGAQSGPSGLPHIAVARNAAELEAAARASARPVIYIDRNWLAVSSPRQIQQAVAFRQNPGSNPFAASSLGQRIDQAYAEGVGWLLAADLRHMVDRAPQGAGAALGWLGLDNADRLLVEQKTGGAGGEYRATLGFSQPRHGVAAWVAEPAPMGALDFISPKAFSAVGAVTRDPALILDDIFQMVSANAGGVEAMETSQRERRLNIRNDLAAPLGNEFLIALDGPILPTPAWRMIIEVNDAARLQNNIENAVANANREAAQSAVALSSEVVDGRTFYQLNVEKLPFEIHYAYWGGYMVLGPKRTFVMDSIQTHDSGISLARSPAFRAQLPDGRDTASGLFYQNAQALANALPSSALSQAISKAGSATVSLYGESDRIVLSGRGVLGMNPSNFGLARLRELARGGIQ